MTLIYLIEKSKIAIKGNIKKINIESFVMEHKKAHAKKLGMSLNLYINNLIERDFI